MTHVVDWHWRSREPAKNPPSPDYPYGIALDMAHPGRKACDVILTYPAPGVGTWFILCQECGYTVAVTAAGRADDPTKVRIPCKQDGEAALR
jgi:hypothetical protein